MSPCFERNVLPLPAPVHQPSLLPLLTLPHQDMIPTVGFNMRKVSKGGVTIKLWDLGGQVRGPFMLCFRLLPHTVHSASSELP